VAVFGVLLLDCPTNNLQLWLILAVGLSLVEGNFQLVLAGQPTRQVEHQICSKDLLSSDVRGIQPPLRDFHPAFGFTVNVRRSKIGDGISNAN
jgi:hypothetical protein